MGNTSVVAGAVPPLLIHMLKLQFLVAQTVTAFGKGTSKEPIKLK